MKVLEKLHKIPDVYILSLVGVGLAIILIYFIATLSSLKQELSELHGKIDTLEGKQSETIKNSITAALLPEIRSAMRSEFEYDRQTYKFIIEE